MKNWLWFILFLASSTSANIIITGTRVVYPAEQKLVNVQLSNETDRPALMQAWIDDGDEFSSPSTLSGERVPFIIVPPVARMEANEGQALRIAYTGAKSLPVDRESLFYLNVLDIPPKPKQNEQGSNNYLQISLRSRIKLFYRPKLAMPIDEAYGKVQWSLQKNGLLIENPTPYYITFTGALVNNKPIGYIGMVAPFANLEVKTKAKLHKGQKLTYSIINDYGGDYQQDTIIN
ncbi:hypothetical protein B0186_02060 [Canicola haemoglobinophilus]|uniref:Chaperone protein HifB n=1 Tax=Canicola haemoglobinophilus TaxID=733 RepID=A0A1V4B2Y0_9PAST|nr:molecular chaperone [Canicola haemoglobinophilus]OOS01669.1 hypothetical protein B0186_02060 [Canicola haemoglobinophilus]STO55396.1 f17-like fimbrial chaperone [Canicola haemoglobinophilus]STO59120.1 f17-like fimbrial chaperone [Canicola haemoglobinophilus]STO67724.1 f17-like fimbrial chaperone [Canicola haemoglobinophilus]STO91855.1 f17-like fimbrial chaperone [Canicola haemoglobinophilus]